MTNALHDFCLKCRSKSEAVRKKPKNLAGAVQTSGT